MENIQWLEQWYQNNCNGEWEQTYGIEIGTLDNPGWYINIGLNETRYAGLVTEEFSYDKGLDDWIRCFIEDGCFKGYGDCLKLGMILQIFRNWIEEMR